MAERRQKRKKGRTGKSLLNRFRVSLTQAIHLLSPLLPPPSISHRTRPPNHQSGKRNVLIDAAKHNESNSQPEGQRKIERFVPLSLLLNFLLLLLLMRLLFLALSSVVAQLASAVADVVADPGRRGDKRACVQHKEKTKGQSLLACLCTSASPTYLLLPALLLIKFQLSGIYFGVKTKNKRKQEQVSPF